MPKSDKPRHSQRFLSDLRFAKNWLSKPRSTGSITPTGKSAARLMASFVSPDTGQPVLELGPGTGSVTREILATGLSPDQLTCVEYNRDFCKHLSRLYPDSNIVEGDAFNLDETLGPDFQGRFSVILSCLPLLNFPRAARAGYIENALGFARKAAPSCNCVMDQNPLLNLPMAALPASRQNGFWQIFPRQDSGFIVALRVNIAVKRAVTKKTPITGRNFGLLKKPKILILAGSIRSGAYSQQLADAFTAELVNHDCEVSRITLADYDLPIILEMPKSEKDLPANAVKLARQFDAHDAIIVSTPEYNGSVPPLLKNAIDWISTVPGHGYSELQPFKGKISAIASSSPGLMGGISAIGHLREVLVRLGMLVISEQVSVGNAGSAFDAKGRLSNERPALFLSNACKSLVEKASQLA